MERAVALAESHVIELDDLPATVRGEYAANVGPSLRQRDTMRAWGARYARLVLDRCHGNKRETCRVLDISYHTLGSYLRYRGAGAEEASAEAVGSAAVVTGGGPHVLAS